MAAFNRRGPVLVRYPIRWAIETLEQKTLEQNLRQSKPLPAAALAEKLTSE
jgi:hypothetical protein